MFSTKTNSLLFTLLLVFLLTIDAIGQPSSCDSISWTKSTKILWEDFKAEPQIQSEFGAVSRIGLSYKLKRINDSINIIIACYFDPCTSWTRFKSYTDLTLPHEQTHFDIAEYFKRIFIKELLQTHFSKTNISDVKVLYLKIVSQRKKMDDTYDRETDFHRNSKQQAAWTKKILQMINELQSYDKSIINLRLAD